MELLSTNNVQEANLIKQYLINNGIHAELINEFTVQTAPYLSSAIGGIKVVVSEDDFHEAVAIVEQGFGIIITEETTNVKGFEEYILNWTNKIPFINKLKPTIQILTSFGLIVVVLGIALMIYLTPSTSEKLTKTNWCLKQILYEGKERHPNTVETIMLEFTGRNYCAEKIKFHQSGGIELPGFNTPRIRGHWEIKDKHVSIHNVENFPKFYNGEYEIKLTYQGELILKSEKLEIQCVPYDLNFAHLFRF